MKKLCLLILIALTFSCIEEMPLTFTEVSSKFNDNAVIEINIPNAVGNTTLSATINKKVKNHIANQLNFSEDDSDSIILNEAVKKFDAEYKSFQNDFEESALVWEAMFDGEVTYQSSEIISIAINSYLNTGGAHGNLNITFLNFNPRTGGLLSLDEIILNKIAFEDIAKQHFKVATQITDDTGYGDYFFGDDFHLPANIGFNDEGVTLFYNVYEIASYAVGITEFTIPFTEINDYLNVN
jgi:hypothetical protein